MYWDKVVPLVDLNIDGWFLDGPEPDHIASFYHFVRMQERLVECGIYIHWCMRLIFMME